MKIKSAATAVATFGAATATMYISPSAEAGVINLTPNPGSVAFQTITSNAVGVDLGLGGSAADFQQWNDVVGKTLFSVADGLAGIRNAFTSSTISAGDSFNTAIGFSTNAAVVYLGLLATSGDVGWMKIDMGGSGGTITYVEAYLDNMGNPIHVGTTSGNGIPEPTTLGLTALGLLAAGARGKRRRAAKTAH